jgi:hypothetical protein
MKEAEAQALQKEAERLRSLSGGFSTTKRKKAVVDAFKRSQMPSYPQARSVAHASDRFVISERNSPKYDGAMLQREADARAITHETRKRVDQAYNKGGLQLLTESEFAAMGRGELRRRT